MIFGYNPDRITNFALDHCQYDRFIFIFASDHGIDLLMTEIQAFFD